MKQIEIVYEREYPELRFSGEDAKIVKEALFFAEANGAISCHFTTTDGKEYNLRTDKYLYWTEHEK